MIIEEDNISLAWGRAFREAYQSKEIAPLVVVIKVTDQGEPQEVPQIREKLDELLHRNGNASCNTVANTIFPKSLWNPHEDRHQLFKRYHHILPRLRKYNANRYGTYFERLTAFGGGRDFREPFNQLEFVIDTWERGNRRRSAFRASILDPHVDHKHQPRRGFPCLQYVSFGRSKSGLAMTGVYATQYIFEKAYGNYLGLYWLGRFMAHEMDLELEKVTCIAVPADRGEASKKYLAPLADIVESVLP